VPVMPVLKFVGALVLFAIVVHIAMYGAFKFFESREKAAERESSPLARTREQSLPPEPRLQLAPGFGVTKPDGTRVDLSYRAVKSGAIPQPQSEYREVLKEWERELKEYGWADQKAGTVRLPIDDAIKLYAQKAASKQSSPIPGPSPTATPGVKPAAATPTPAATEHHHE
jgi:hypothetical protein